MVIWAKTESDYERTAIERSIWTSNGRCGHSVSDKGIGLGHVDALGRGPSGYHCCTIDSDGRLLARILGGESNNFTVCCISSTITNIRVISMVGGNRNIPVTSSTCIKVKVNGNAVCCNCDSCSIWCWVTVLIREGEIDGVRTTVSTSRVGNTRDLSGWVYGEDDAFGDPNLRVPAEITGEGHCVSSHAWISEFYCKCNRFLIILIMVDRK